jgi:Tfp pilus assembly protein FimT
LLNYSTSETEIGNMSKHFRRKTVAPQTPHESGFSVIDLVVTMGVAAILLKNAAPAWQAQRLQIQTAQRQVVAVLRLARVNAITKSAHYQVSFPDATHINIARMQESAPNSGTWIIDSANITTQPLPTVAQVKSTVVAELVEFNSRGFAVKNTLPKPGGASTPQVDIQDTFGAARSVQVWPSGQINGL